MDIDTLKTLISVARLGSFASAARARGMDPSGVSRLVAQAEAEIGARLFQRTTRRIGALEGGAGRDRRIEPVVAEFDAAQEAARSARQTISGTVRLSASVAYGHVRLVPLLPRLRAAMPELKFELALSDSNLDLIREGVDLAIRLAPAVEGDLICSKLHRTRYRVCASPDYLSRAPALNEIDDLMSHDVLRHMLPDYRRRWMFKDRGGVVREIPVEGACVISNALGLLEAARLGLGPALLADWMIADDLASGRLIDVFPDYEATATTFETAAWLLYPSRAFLPARVRAVITQLQAALGNT